jgi:hypothetical protein
MHQAPPEHDPPAPRGHDTQDKPRPLSHSDPPPQRSGGRPPMLLIIGFAVLVTVFVVLHLSGAVGH